MAAEYSELTCWIDVCELERIAPETGVCALIEGRQIALVRAGDAVFALDNLDPFAHAYVISRGIVGDRAGRPKIASPMYKHAFDLETGRCLDDPAVSLETFPVRVRAGRVELQAVAAVRGARAA